MTIAAMPRRPSSLPAQVPDAAPADSPPGRDEVLALARGIAVLRALAAAPGALTNRALADATGIPKATVSRIAGTLAASGLIRQDAETDRYRLGPALLDLSSAYLRTFDMREICRPHLAALAEQAQASVHLGVRDGLDILMIDTVRPRSAVILTRTDVGTRMDIATSASGRAYFCALAAPDRAALLDDYRKAAPERWDAVQQALARAIAEGEPRGYGCSFREWHRDINAIGFALRGPRGELYAVSCGGPAYSLSPEELHAKVAPAALAARAAIARACGVPVAGRTR